MKIAIATEKKSKDSMISKLSGRAPFYLIFENGELIKTIKNPFKIGGGAGFSVAQMLSDEKVDLVISGSFGENMLSALENKGIKHKQVFGITVKEALENA